MFSWRFLLALLPLGLSWRLACLAPCLRCRLLALPSLGACGLASSCLAPCRLLTLGGVSCRCALLSLLALPCAWRLACLALPSSALRLALIWHLRLASLLPSPLLGLASLLPSLGVSWPCLALCLACLAVSWRLLALVGLVPCLAVSCRLLPSLGLPSLGLAVSWRLRPCFLLPCALPSLDAWRRL